MGLGLAPGGAADRASGGGRGGGIVMEGRVGAEIAEIRSLESAMERVTEERCEIGGVGDWIAPIFSF